MASGKHHMEAYWNAYRQGKLDALFDGLFNCDHPDYVKRQAAFYGYGRAETLGYKAGLEAVLHDFEKLNKERLTKEAAGRDS